MNNQYEIYIKKSIKNDQETEEKKKYEDYIEEKNNPVLNNDKIDFKIGGVMLALCTSVLFPYSAILSSLDYFVEIYPNYYTSSTIPFSYMLIIAVSYFLVLNIHHKIKHHYNIFGGFIVYIIVMICVPFINLSSIKGTLASYIITVLLIGITAVIDGFIQSSIMAIAGYLGPNFSIFCQIGYGFSGVVATILRVTIKLSIPDRNESYRKGIIIYFSLGCFIIIIASLLFLYLVKSPVVGKYITQSNKVISKVDEQSTLTKESPLKYVILKNMHYNLILITMFTISLSVYPSLYFKIKNSSIREDWYMVSVVAVFGLFDCIGRIVPLFLNKLVKNTISVTWVLTLSRSIFIVLVFLEIYIEKFNHLAITYITLIIFGFSDGYISSICVSEPPRQVEKQYKQLSGIVTSFCVNIGLTIGSSINLLIVLLIN